MSLIRRLLAGLLIALVVLGLLEACARVIFTIREDLEPRTSDWYTFSADLGWERNPNFDGSYMGVHYQFDSHGFFGIDTEKLFNCHDPKILAIGDSVTFGFGVPQSLHSLKSWMTYCQVSA